MILMTAVTSFLNEIDHNDHKQGIEVFFLPQNAVCDHKWCVSGHNMLQVIVSGLNIEPKQDSLNLQSHTLIEIMQLEYWLLLIPGTWCDYLI